VSTAKLNVEQEVTGSYVGRITSCPAVFIALFCPFKEFQG
jgi:hypothetical protein